MRTAVLIALVAFSAAGGIAWLGRKLAEWDRILQGEIEED